MTPQQEKQLKSLGVFTLAQAEKVGLSQQRISRLVQSGRINRVERGLYVHAEAELPQTVGFQIACAKFGPKSAIGGLSALFHYNLAEQVPAQTWIIVPPETRTRERSYRLLRTKTGFDKGIIEKDGYRIVSVERALIEGLKFASKIGERTALKAIRTALSQRLTSEGKLGKMAKELGLLSVYAKYSEAIAL